MMSYLGQPDTNIMASPAGPEAPRRHADTGHRRQPRPPEVHKSCQPKAPIHTIFLRNLPYDLSDEELSAICFEFGQISHLFSIANTRGIAFVTYYDIREAKNACEGLEGREVHEREIHASYAYAAPESSQKPYANCSTVSVRPNNPETIINESQVEEILSKIGEIRSLQVGESSNSFTVKFYDLRAARDSVKASGNYEITNGEKLIIEFNLKKEDVPEGPTTSVDVSSPPHANNSRNYGRRERRRSHDRNEYNLRRPYQHNYPQDPYRQYQQLSYAPQAPQYGMQGNYSAPQYQYPQPDYQIPQYPQTQYPATQFQQPQYNQQQPTQIQQPYANPVIQQQMLQTQQIPQYSQQPNQNMQQYQQQAPVQQQPMQSYGQMNQVPQQYYQQNMQQQQPQQIHNVQQQIMGIGNDQSGMGMGTRPIYGVNSTVLLEDPDKRRQTFESLKKLF